MRDRLGHLAGSLGNRVLDEVDPDMVVQRIDVDALLARVDVDAFLDRIDVNALLDRVDVNALLDRVEPDRLLDRVDVDRFLQRVDVDALVRRAGVPELIAGSTGQVAGSALDLARRQLVGLDVGIGRVIARLLRRDPDALPAGPPLLVADGRRHVVPPAPDRPRERARFEVSGFYAGPLVRVLALAGDIALAGATFTWLAVALSWLLAVVFGVSFEADQRTGPLWGGALVLWFFTYWYATTAAMGRTPAMMVAGLRIVARDGSPVRPRRAFVRTVTLPLSLLFFGAGGALMVVDRERRTLHDRLAGTTVVYDWGGRPAELPTPLGRWIADHSDAASGQG
jgi:uncharacterized RDD family membrane protein YckC